MADPISSVISIVGGIFGASKKRKAQKYANKANAVERQQAQLAAAVERRDLVRSARIARAQAVAASATETGGLASSAPQGAISSVGSQLTSNLAYFDQQVGLGNVAQGYRNKAGKYAQQADTIGTITSLLTQGTALYNAYSSTTPSGAESLSKAYTGGPSSFSKYSPWLPTQVGVKSPYDRTRNTGIKYLGK